MAVSKVIYGGQTLIDLTADTVKADKLLKGYKAHGANGELVEGTCTYDADTSDATARADEIIMGKTAYVNGEEVTGTMMAYGSLNLTLKYRDSGVPIPNGYHDGSNSVNIDATEKAKIIPENIREGVTILGIKGAMSGTEDANAQSKTVTPSTTEQTVLPDTADGYNYLAQVTVAPIPYTETDNSAGGKTVTIG